MSICVFVKSATDLPKSDTFSKSDPYCELTFHNERRKTKVIDNDQNPEWNEALNWALNGPPELTEVIEVDILDHEDFGKSDSAMAKGTVPLENVIKEGNVFDLDVALTSPEGEPLGSKLRVDLHYETPLPEALKGEVSAAKARIEELEELLRNLKATAAEKEGEISDAKEEIERLKADISEQNKRLNAEINDLKAAAVEKEGELSEAREQVEKLKGTLIEKEGELSDTKAMATGKEGELFEQNERLKAEISDLKATAAEKEGELSEQNERLKAEISDLKASTTGTKEQIERLKKEATDAEAKIGQLQEAASAEDELKAQNESLKEEVSALRQQIEELEEEQGKRERSEPASGEGEGEPQEGWCNLL